MSSSTTYENATPQNATIDDADHGATARHAALNFIFMYAYPILEYGKFARGLPTPTKTNSFWHGRHLTTANWKAVVRPNVDTLYSSAFTDVSACDLEVHVPEIVDRYWCMSIYDAYGNNIANIGSVDDRRQGKYLIQFSPSGPFGFFKGSPPGRINGQYQGFLNVPTPYGILLGRFATTPDKVDQQLVNGLQDKLGIEALPRDAPAVAPSLDLDIFKTSGYHESSTVSVESAVLRLAKAWLPYNQSPVLADRPKIARALEQSGVLQQIADNYTTNYAQLSQYASRAALTVLNAPGGHSDLGNSWQLHYPSCAGNFGSNYAARYSIAKYGYLCLTPEQAVYPSLPHNITLGRNRACIIRFSQKPVLRKTGFWSLTAYDADQFLVNNTLNRYCLGDRDNLKFPDGTPLADQTKDGPFEILVQAANVPPPKEWKDNWLPAPKDGAKMTITLRWYCAKKTMTDGGYEYPIVKYVDAIGSPKSAHL